jgi:AcrR family transcriptional regulator
MTRTADAARRAELLERILDYACANGISELSLRPLAKAVGSSPRVLLYYFKSKDALLVEVMTQARARQLAQLAEVKFDSGLSAREICTLCWKMMSDERYEPLYHLFYEVFALATINPKRFPGFLDRAIGDWIGFIAAPSIAGGESQERAHAFATMILAGFRGFLMDLIATHDRVRVNRGVELWLDLIDTATLAATNKEYDATA